MENTSSPQPSPQPTPRRSRPAFLAALVAIVGTSLGGIGAYYSVQLYKNLRTDFEELLPTTARSVLDLGEVTRRLESIDNLGILVFSKDAAAGKKLTQDLARELEKEPKALIASVEYKIDRELKFFAERQALYLELPDLIRVRNYVRDRIEYERELYNPLNIFSEEEIPEPRFDFLGLQKKYEGKASGYSRFPEGYYATPDGTKRVVLINRPGGGGMDLILRLKHRVEEIVAQLNPASYGADVTVHYTGGVQDQIEEHAALIADLELSTIIVAVLVSIAMLLFYRNVRATVSLVFSLFMGTFWTFGASYFAVGYLNANSAFMGSIVIGNGINFGIIFLARYIEERRLGLNNHDAIRRSVNKTWSSTGTAALAAALSYGSLILTGFRGFRQFGIIGLIGMVLCWISAYTMLPAYLTLFDRISPLIKPGSKAHKAYLADAVAHLVNRFPKVLVAISVVATVVSIGMFTRFTPQILETNLSKLRNRQSVESGSAFLSKYLDEIFQRYLTPLVIMPKERSETALIAKKLRAMKIEQGEHSLIANVQTMDDFLPGDERTQNAKIEVLKQIRETLNPKILKRLSPADKARVSSFLNPAVFKPITINDMPALILQKFTEKDGTVGKLVLVEPPLTNDTWDGNKLIFFIKELRRAADEVHPGTAVAGTIAITSDMIESVSADGPKATLFAFIAVIILVIVLFRHLQTVSLVLVSLFLGVLWLAGFILGFHLKINFLNFIALPITFGIGVDYGVNIFQRYREEHGEGIINVIRNTGGAVGLSSFTTITGYTSLLIASNQGFVSFGTLAVAGELACVIAAVISLPALLILINRRRKKHHLPEVS